MAVVAAELGKTPELGPALGYAPFVLWCAGAALLVAVARAGMPFGAQRPGL